LSFPVLCVSLEFSGGSATPARTAAEETAIGDLPFEEAIGRLETVVDRLEAGDLALEAALASFEQGVQLTRRCAEQLKAAEQRIELLTREGNEWVPRAFGEEREESEELEEGTGESKDDDDDAWDEEEDSA
jgi:exodeoxyribonuclease VII small subunit